MAKRKPMKKLKFRIWDRQLKKFLYQLPEQHHLDWKRFEVQQFIGLLDKRGKEICEGDIVDFDWNNGYGDIFHHRGIVMYSAPNYVFKVGKEIWRWLKSNVEVEVIGNIYENENLLEENN